MNKIEWNILEKVKMSNEESEEMTLEALSLEDSQHRQAQDETPPSSPRSITKTCCLPNCDHSQQFLCKKEKSSTITQNADGKDCTEPVAVEHIDDIPVSI
jgi:hypothetical protein